MRRSAPSARSTPASRRTGSSPAASRPAGRQKLHELAEAEAELAEQTTPAPEPSREQIEALARDLPEAVGRREHLRAKDRKRLLRALIADITITSQPEGRELRVGIRWRSGASEQHTVQRPKTRQEVIRTPSRGDRADQAPRRRQHQRADRRAAQRRRAARRHRRPVRG